MLIDTNATAPGRANIPASLTPELDQLLASLKLQVGQKAEASVSRVLMLAESERQQLLAMRGADKPSPGQKTLLAVLGDTNVKVVELTIRSHPVATLTNLPLTQGSQIQVLVTPRGLVLLPPASPAPPSPNGSPPLPQPAGLPLPPVAPANTQPQPSITRPQEVIGPTGTPTTGPVKTLPSTDPAKKIQLTKGAAPSAESNLLSTSKTVEPGKVNTGATQISLDPIQKTLLAKAMSQTLPIAQPLKTLLTATDATNRLLTAAQSTPPVMAELRTLLNKVSNHALDVSGPIKPEALRQAMNASGLFYERRMMVESPLAREREPAPLSERDLKGLLIQLSQWTGGQLLTPAAPGGQSSSDTLAQLMMSLARLLSPRQASKNTPVDRQLSLAVKELAERSLAQIQLQQFRTLSSRMPDTATPGQWHLDIPLKLPDAYGNLYIQLFEPRSAAEEKRPSSQRRTRTPGDKRWKVFLELELDQLGSLAAEVSVLEKNVEATLWSGNNDLRQRVHTQLENLRGDLQRQGIVVTDLRCSDNPPPEQKIRLDYALVDIKT